MSRPKRKRRAPDFYHRNREYIQQIEDLSDVEDLRMDIERPIPYSGAAELEHEQAIKDRMSKLIVKQSHIANSGRGVFANARFKKGIIIAEYLGKVYLKKPFHDEFRNVEKDYAVTTANGEFVIDGDPRLKLNTIASYINDPLGWKDAVNCKFDSMGFSDRVFVVTTKNIYKGDELYLSYGDKYWVGRNPGKSTFYVDLTGEETDEEPPLSSGRRRTKKTTVVIRT